MHSTTTRRDFLNLIGLGGVGLALSTSCGGSSKKKTNVLFIAVDDLRPQLNCYGHKQMISPNIDKLASGGSTFERCYCQVPVCGASRASLLAGVHPTRERKFRWDLKASEDWPEYMTLPEHFKNHGYHTVSRGKIFHHLDDSLDGWSEEPWWPPSASEGWRDYVLEKNQEICKNSGNGRGPAFESVDVEDNAYRDGKLAEKGIADLQRLKEMDKPFFLALGFFKPHLPFNAPTKYWDTYKHDEIDLADNPFRPKDAPDAALHNWGELRNYTNIPKEGDLDDEMARTLIHGYYACVTYTDRQIGKILDELDRLGLSDNTVVVLWGDHGWNLEEHGLWCKHSNFETSLHSPLLVRAPGVGTGARISALTEFLDIYPSLCELCNLPKPTHLEGKSFVSLMNNPDETLKPAVFSRWHNGQSVKTDRYRYTEWFKTGEPPYARMLYDHKTDPMENVNISERPENKELVEQMHELLHTR